MHTVCWMECKPSSYMYRLQWWPSNYESMAMSFVCYFRIWQVQVAARHFNMFWRFSSLVSRTQWRLMEKVHPVDSWWNNLKFSLLTLLSFNFSEEMLIFHWTKRFFVGRLRYKPQLEMPLNSGNFLYISMFIFSFNKHSWWKVELFPLYFMLLTTYM